MTNAYGYETVEGEKILGYEYEVEGRICGMWCKVGYGSKMPPELHDYESAVKYLEELKAYYKEIGAKDFMDAKYRIVARITKCETRFVYDYEEE